MSPLWYFVIAAALILVAKVLQKPASDIQNSIKMPPFTASVIILVCYFLFSVSTLLGVAAIFRP